MLTLAKIPYTKNGSTRPIDELEAQAAKIYNGEMPKIWRDGTGWLTVEPTPGTYNYNPKSKLAKVVFYEQEPRTRHGFYAKMRVMPNGDLMSV